MHNYCGNQKCNWTKFLPKGIGIAKYRMISRNLWNCEGGEKKPEKRRDDQCYSLHHAKRAQIDTFLGHIIIHYNEICVSNGDYTWNYACCVRTWTLIKCASSVLLSRYWILCFTLGLKVYYTFRLKNIKKGLLKPKKTKFNGKISCSFRLQPYSISFYWRWILTNLPLNYIFFLYLPCFAKFLEKY